MSSENPPGRERAQGEQSTTQEGQNPLQAAIEFPLTQAVSFQKEATQLFLNGLEVSNWANERGVELTKDLLGNYLQTLDRTAQQTEQLAQQEARMFQDAARNQQELGQQGFQQLERQMEGGRQWTQDQLQGAVEQFPPTEQSQQPGQRSGSSQQPTGGGPQGQQSTGLESSSQGTGQQQSSMVGSQPGQGGPSQQGPGSPQPPTQQSLTPGSRTGGQQSPQGGGAPGQQSTGQRSGAPATGQPSEGQPMGQQPQESATTDAPPPQ